MSTAKVKTDVIDADAHVVESERVGLSRRCRREIPPNARG